jgi:phosphate transport system permease protein
MTSILVPPGPPSRQPDAGPPWHPAPPAPLGPADDVPIPLKPSPTGIDRAFRALLLASASFVLLILVAIVVFLAVKGWPAITKFGTGFITGSVWSPDGGHAGVLPLLVGSIAIALVALVVALPVSLATALMINEYLPPSLRPVLTSVVDLLATVPSIVYGFWGLELISHLQAPPARWLVAHFNFVPLLRTPTPNSYVSSIFACGLVSAITLIPIITSISREVMAQTPRDMCEAAYGLGGTRWGMVTDVILPFSRKGILSGALLGLGRGLGETMIVVLILSSANKLTPGLLGPNGLGSIAKEITSNFTTATPIGKSALILAGLVLFMSTLLVNMLARYIVDRSTRGGR